MLAGTTSQSWTMLASAIKSDQSIICLAFVEKRTSRSDRMTTLTWQESVFNYHRSTEFLKLFLLALVFSRPVQNQHTLGQPCRRWIPQHSIWPSLGRAPYLFIRWCKITPLNPLCRGFLIWREAFLSNQTLFFFLLMYSKRHTRLQNFLSASSRWESSVLDSVHPHVPDSWIMRHMATCEHSICTDR